MLTRLFAGLLVAGAITNLVLTALDKNPHAMVGWAFGLICLIELYATKRMLVLVNESLDQATASFAQINKAIAHHD